MKSPRRLLTGVIAGVVIIAGAGWVVGARLTSPADEAARRAAPPASLVTVAVERRKLVSTVVFSGMVEYGSPLPISLAGVVGGTAELQRATRAPKKGRIKEGAVLMEVNGRPVVALRGTVPMHRTMTPGTEGDDVKQLQRALRRLGYGTAVSGVFDSLTIAAVTKMYAKKGYEAQQPTLADRQTYDTLRKAVQAAEATLATEQQTLDRGHDVLPLKVKLDNAKKDLREARAARAEAESRELTAADETKLAAADAAVRAAEEKLLAAEQALDAAGNSPTSTPTPAPAPTGTATPVPVSTTAPDTSLLELQVANAEADLAAARDARDLVLKEVGEARESKLAELRKAERTAKETVVTAEQALRQARQLSPARLKVAHAKKDVAAAKEMLAEYARTYGVSIPPGELVFLPNLPARVQKVSVKPGQRVEDEVAIVTASTFTVSGAVEAAESELLRPGMQAGMELATGRTYPASITAIGEKAKAPGAEEVADGSQPVRLTPSSGKGLRSGVAVTARVTVGATKEPVLVVPVTAVITSADGKARVRVEYATDKTRDVEVRTGLTADGNVEVSGELKEGDRVVVGNA